MLNEYLKTVVVISCGFYNKLPQACGLKMAEIYSLTFLKARSSKSVSLGQNQGVSMATLPPEAIRKNLVLVSYKSF